MSDTSPPICTGTFFELHFTDGVRTSLASRESIPPFPSTPTVFLKKRNSMGWKEVRTYFEVNVDKYNFSIFLLRRWKYRRSNIHNCKIKFYTFEMTKVLHQIIFYIDLVILSPNYSFSPKVFFHQKTGIQKLIESLIMILTLNKYKKP